jgi:NIPSNAP
MTTTQWQLRDYQIAEGRLDEFLDAWTRGVLPLRRAAGFEVQAWTVPGESRFVWLLAYEGAGTFEAADEAYYDTPARAALDPDPAQWIVEQRKVMLEPVAASSLHDATPRR